MNESLVLRRVRGQGRGVFAGRAFRAGEVIEVCPVIPLTAAEADTCAVTVLDNYFFEWGPDGNAYALALGYGALYNHAADPNAAFSCRIRQLEIVFRATRPIKAGEQITIDYQWPDTSQMPPSRV